LKISSVLFIIVFDSILYRIKRNLFRWSFNSIWIYPHVDKSLYGTTCL